MNLKKAKQEEGFWSALVILFMVTLMLMGLGSFVLIRSEGYNVVNQINALKAEYAATGAVYYGFQRLKIGDLEESYPVTIGDVEVYLDTSGTLPDIYLDVTANVSAGGGSMESNLGIELDYLRLDAIYTTGDVSNIAVLDSTGYPDDDLLVENADELPEIYQGVLDSLASDQSQVFGDPTYEPADGYPSGDFFRPDGITPNVTHVLGNLRVRTGRTVWGIFVVEGNLQIDYDDFGADGYIEGVVYMPNAGCTVTIGSDAQVTGGIVTNGDILRDGLNPGIVQHNPVYMRAFEPYHEEMGFKIDEWIYE